MSVGGPAHEADQIPQPASPSETQEVTRTWTGFPVALGAVVAAVGAFLPYEELRTGSGTYSFTGVGSEKATGSIPASMFVAGNVGISIFVLAVITLLCGLLVVVRQGRWWAGVASLILSGVGLATSVYAVTAAHRDADTFSTAQRFDFTGSPGVGAVLGVVGMAVAFVASVLALVIRVRGSAAHRRSRVAA